MWWVIRLACSGSLSKKPENTMRVMAALVSYGQPKVHQISNFDFFSDA